MQREIPQLLLIEEDVALADLTSFRLELLGYSVKFVHTGEAALDSVQQELPDLFILDPVLPGMDGIELINKLQNDPQTNAIPILVLAINPDLNAVQRAFEAGAKDYLVIPYDPAVLEQKLEKLLSEKTELVGSKR